MGSNSRRFRLGLFVIATATLFVALLSFILQNSLNAARATYFILFAENVKGMVAGSKVNFQGVPIGVVRDLRFQDGKTVVELSVDPLRASIQNLTLARMDRLLVTGQVTIELEGYGAEGKPLPPGSFIETKDDPLSSLRGTIPEVADRAALVLVHLDQLLGRADRLLDERNCERIAAVLANVERASALLADVAAPAVVATLQDLRTVTLPEATATLAEVRAAAARLQRLEPEFTALAREATAFLGSLRSPAQVTLASLRQVLDELRGFARQLKLAPDSLLFGVQSPAAPMGGER